ncbi:MAG: hypothetical protein AAF557_01035 [Pseudomonadota bacterium]
MRLSRRSLLLGSASVAVIGSAAFGTQVRAAIDVGSDAESQALLLRMVRVMYPHAQFPDAPYVRSCESIRSDAKGSIGVSLMFADGLADLSAAGFGDMDDAAALAHLKSIEDTPFFGFVRSKAVVVLYNDPEVWGILGYEGASFDQGGYIDRGFNDLDWLPDPRITEFKG